MPRPVGLDINGCQHRHVRAGISRFVQFPFTRKAQLDVLGDQNRYLGQHFSRDTDPAVSALEINFLNICAGAALDCRRYAILIFNARQDAPVICN